MKSSTLSFVLLLAGIAIGWFYGYGTAPKTQFVLRPPYGSIDLSRGQWTTVPAGTTIMCTTTTAATTSVLSLADPTERHTVAK